MPYSSNYFCKTLKLILRLSFIIFKTNGILTRNRISHLAVSNKDLKNGDIRS